MRTSWYLLHDLTEMTQLRFKTQRQLIRYLRDLGCRFDNNELAQISLPVGPGDIYNEDVGELYLETDDKEYCIEVLL